MSRDRFRFKCGTIERGRDRSGRGEKGFVLVTLSLLMGLLLAHGTALTIRALGEVRASQRTEALTQAFYLAEAGIDEGIRWLRNQPPPDRRITLPVPSDERIREELQKNGQFIKVELEPDPGNPNSYLKTYLIKSKGSIGDPNAPLATRTVWLKIQTESFARYAYFSNSETTSAGARVWFITGDRIEGPTHTNGIFNMYGYPVFDGPVSSVHDRLNLWGQGPPTTDPVFNGGLTLGIEPIPFPNAPPSDLIQAAQQSGYLFVGDTQVTLVADGTMRVTNRARGWVNQSIPVPANGAFYVSGGTLTVQGTLDGKMTLGADRDIRITNSVVYRDDPANNPNSDDLLGLVAGGDVVVASGAPFDIRIDASILAMHNSFFVEDWNRGSPKGTLTIYGGVIQRHRGPVGTFNSNTGRKLTGYTKDYHYDTRLRSQSPPFFPLTGKYQPIVWKEPDWSDTDSGSSSSSFSPDAGNDQSTGGEWTGEGA
jgi:hypothetical protein